MPPSVILLVGSETFLSNWRKPTQIFALSYKTKNEVWPKECPEAIAERRITFEPIDFFASSPVPGYYVR